jgi:hypothetical protein
MRSSEPDTRSGWSFLGFLRSVLGDGASFWRLFALILLLIFGYALAKGDVTALYDHLTQRVTIWVKWGIPPGSGVIYVTARKYFIHRQAVRATRALESEAVPEEPEKAKKETKKRRRQRKARNQLPGSGATAGSGPKKALK